MRYITVALFLGRLVWAQTTTGAHGPATFEVASVKSDSGRYINLTGGPGTSEPERISYSGLTLTHLITIGYDIFEDQLSGPEWMNTEKYAVEAKLPAGTNREQFHEMLRNLLTERFGLLLRHETKNTAVYELVVAKGGPKMQRAAVSVSAPGGLPVPQSLSDAPITDKNGCPVRAVGLHGYTIDRNHPVPCGTFRNVSTLDLAQYLEHFVGSELFGPLTARVHVTDETNLEGKFDFTLHWDFNPKLPRSVAAEPDLGPTIFEALEKELGLKLQKVILSLEFLVVERANRVPTSN